MSVPYYPKCGAEPPYYQYIGENKVESISHISWENCVRDMTLHATPTTAPTPSRSPFDLTTDMSGTGTTWKPSPPPVADQMSYWISQHTSLLVAGAVLALLILAVLVVILVSRRAIARDRQQV